MRKSKMATKIWEKCIWNVAQFIESVGLVIKGPKLAESMFSTLRIILDIDPRLIFILRSAIW